LANLNNLNKENIITVDIKNASISTQGNMTFYITDIKTCNIYCQLVINRSKSNLIKKFAPIENAIDYKVILRAVDPNKSGIKELEFTLLNQIEAFFMVELTDEFISCAGDYKCELFVECKVNGVLERITTSPFTYKVNGSIIDELFKDDNDSSGGNSGGGVTPSLIENLATKQYVNEQITDIPNTDLLVTFTSRHIDDAISSYDDEIIKQDFASRDFVNNMINSVKYDIENANYATESFVNEEISKFNTNIGNLLTSSYATKSEMDTAINEAINDFDLSDYATKSYVNETINNKTSYYDMRYATISYVDTEVNEVFNYCASVRTILQNVIDEYADKNYVNTAIANAITPDLSDYATHTYVSNFFNNSINGRLVDYATKEYVGDEIRELSNSMLNYSDIKDYMADYLWTNEYTTKDYVATEIANAQLGGGEGGSVDLTAYATKEELNNALGDIESLLGEI
jgi:hypothetical protein